MSKSRKWTMLDINKTGLKITPQKQPVKKNKVKRTEPPALVKMKQALQSLNIPFIEEHKFLERRKFRFDIAIPSMKIGIEYEGLMSAKSRHTTITGYTNDCIKYNLAQRRGWTVLRYTVKNYTDMIADLKEVLSTK